MSQVIVTNDNLKPMRERSREQEKKIDREGVTRRWRKSDISGKDPVLPVVGIAVTPVLALWSLLCGVIVLAVTIVEHAFRIVGRLLGGKTSLITGEKISR